MKLIIYDRCLLLDGGTNGVINVQSLGKSMAGPHLIAGYMKPDTR